MQTIDSIKTFSFKQLPEEECYMWVVNDIDSIEHPVKRIFFVSPDIEMTRGDHAHFDCWQTLVCVKGQVKILADDGSKKKSFFLLNYGDAVTVPPGIWCAQEYQACSSLMVLCSHLYNENDYLRDYKKFINYRNEN